MSTASPSTAIFAASVMARLVSGSSAGRLPECKVSLAPRVCEAENGEISPALFAVPTSLSTDRATRASVRRQVSVALVLLAPVANEAAARELLEDFQAAADALLASSPSEAGVAFLSYDADELYDVELLVEQHIFRAQMDFSCLKMDELPCA